MYRNHIPPKRFPLVKGAPQRADGTIPRFLAYETSESYASGVNTPLAVFIATLVVPLVVYTCGPDALEGIAALAAVFLGRCSYVRYRHVRTG